MIEDAEPSRYEVTGISLRLRHPQPRDLGEILRRWGYEVDREWRAGEPHQAPGGRPLEGVRPDSYAYIRLALQASGTLSAALDLILDELQSVGPELQAFAEDGGSAELFVHWCFNANSGDTLDWQLLQRLSESRLDLALDIYPEREREGTVE